jgi:hypothetical protein
MGLCQTKEKCNFRTIFTQTEKRNLRTISTQTALIKDLSVIDDLDTSRYNGLPCPPPPPLRRETPSDYDTDYDTAQARLSLGYDPEKTYV